MSENKPTFIHVYEPLNTACFKVHTTQLIDSGDRVVNVSFIYFVDKDGLPAEVTRLQDYVAYGINKTGAFKSSSKKACLYFTMFLNHILIQGHDRFKITTVQEITKDMMEDFFEHYGLTIQENKEPLSKETAFECLRVVTFTMYHLVKKFGKQMHVSEEELLILKTFQDYRNQTVTKLVPNFHINTSNAYHESLLRELPTVAFETLISLAMVQAPDIVFPMCAQAFAGLRPGEVCNVYFDPDGTNGIQYTYDMRGGHVLPHLKLTEEYALRDDTTSVGGIKKERIQCVFPDFVEAFKAAHEFHMQYRMNHKVLQTSRKFQPMFVNKHGKALTYDTYRKKFNVLVNGPFLEALLKSDNEEIRAYGQEVRRRGLDPHCLRHFFTVQLVLRGLTAAELQYWRGDSNIESSMQYILGKGELMKASQNIGSDFTHKILKIFEKKVHPYG